MPRYTGLGNLELNIKLHSDQKIRLWFFKKTDVKLEDNAWFNGHMSDPSLTCKFKFAVLTEHDKNMC